MDWQKRKQENVLVAKMLCLMVGLIYLLIWQLHVNGYFLPIFVRKSSTTGHDVLSVCSGALLCVLPYSQSRVLENPVPCKNGILLNTHVRSHV